MTEGKLVRDLIPDIIRESAGTQTSGIYQAASVATALAAKPLEDVSEAAGAIHDRDALVMQRVTGTWFSDGPLYGIGPQRSLTSRTRGRCWTKSP
jgi:hypothetical protein